VVKFVNTKGFSGIIADICFFIGKAISVCDKNLTALLLWILLSEKNNCLKNVIMDLPFATSLIKPELLLRKCVFIR
jgi:hypothetical protein